MQKYLNLGGKSGVFAYEAGKDYLKIKFINGAVYLYNYQVTGIENVEQMKTLAISGIGLNTFISRKIKKNSLYN